MSLRMLIRRHVPLRCRQVNFALLGRACASAPDRTEETKVGEVFSSPSKKKRKRKKRSAPSAWYLAPWKKRGGGRSTVPASPTMDNEEKGINLQERLAVLGVQLTPEELRSLVSEIDQDKDGKVSPLEYDSWLRLRLRAKEDEEQKQMVLTYVEDNQLSRAMRYLAALDVFGQAVFAASGTVVAGDAGMNVVGCSVVGVVTACGGGSVIQLLSGSAPVFWFNQQSYLLLAIAVSCFTFYVWPKLEENGLIHDSEAMLFAADSLGLSAFGVLGAHAAIKRGLPLSVAASCGVLICSGGIIRDVICQRQVAIGHDSYAFATFVGAALYCVLRRHTSMPLGLRVLLGSSTILSLRAIAWAFPETAQLPAMDRTWKRWQSHSEQQPKPAPSIRLALGSMDNT